MKDANGKTVYFTIAYDNIDTAASAVNEATATTATNITLNSELVELYEAYHTRRDSNASEFSMFAEVEQIALTASDGDYRGPPLQLTPVLPSICPQ
jgi:hypothetical protein